MAANKFATMLHKNTNKILLILVYAALEWALILMLLLNSLFSYLIAKFANFFGLKPPCPWCCRIDHILEHGKNTKRSFVDEVCETHATEISKLDYCLNHRKLAESQGMCNDCFASRPNKANGVTRMDFVSSITEDGYADVDGIVSCSCCNENINRKCHPPCLLWKPSWSASDYTQKGGPVIEEMVDEKPASTQKPRESFHELEDHADEAEGVLDEHQILSDIDSFSFREASEEDYSKSLSSLQWNEKEEANEDVKEANCEIIAKYSSTMDSSSPTLASNGTKCSCEPKEDDSLNVILPQHKQSDACDFYRMIPLDLIDSSTNENTKFHALVEEHLRKCDKCDNQDGAHTPNLMFETEIGLFEEAFIVDEDLEKESFTMMRDMETYKVGVGGSSVLTCKQVVFENVDNSIAQAARTMSTDGCNIESEEMKQSEKSTALTDEMNSSEAAGHPVVQSQTLIADHTSDECHTQELITSLPFSKENFSLATDQNAEATYTLDEFVAQEGHGSTAGKVAMQDSGSANKNQANAINFESTSNPESEAEEEKYPETPTSVESLQYMHKKFLSDKRESSMEDSQDGSVLSETEVGDGAISIEKLKTALKAERKALSALYAELEEERSASAIAANQTMAMITRLQEEKAAMQMEALQYQRMMEEQSEYDQEALQLLNELMIKREKEKEELEKELEVYRQKVSNYEAKERMRVMRNIHFEDLSSKSCSDLSKNAEDSDGLSIDLNRELGGEDVTIHANQGSSNIDIPTHEVLNLEDMALDCVKHMSALDDSLTEFEEERLSILDQLKELEEKLLAMSGNDDFKDDTKLNQQFSLNDGSDFDEPRYFSCQEQNGAFSGHPKEENGDHYYEKGTLSSMAKRLLPLTDATENEARDDLIAQQPDEHMNQLEENKLAIVEEVDHVYERLQALEADREFLKHCMNSVGKGDRGMDLLQEILQHLRDLKSVELRVRNMDECH